MLDLFWCRSAQAISRACRRMGGRDPRVGVRLGCRRWPLLVGGLLLQLGLASARAQALPLISELFYDAVGSDNGSSFVELAGVPGTPLDGITLEGINGSGGAVTAVIELWGEIPEDGLFVVADHDSDGVSLVDEADQLANFDFQNGPDSVVLRLGEEILDAVGYGAFAPGDVFAGEGAPAPDGAPGSSLARYFADEDSDDNASDFELLDTPTPGSAEWVAVPEPGSALLLTTALIALAAIGSRRDSRRE